MRVTPTWMAGSTSTISPGSTPVSPAARPLLLLDPRPSWRAARGRHLIRIRLVVARGFFEHFAEVCVLATRRLQIEDQVLDAQPQVIQRFLQRADGLAEALVTLAGLV